MFLTSIDIISNLINTVLQSSLLYFSVFCLLFTFIRALRTLGDIICHNMYKRVEVRDAASVTPSYVHLIIETAPKTIRCFQKPEHDK